MNIQFLAESSDSNAGNPVLNIIIFIAFIVVTMTIVTRVGNKTSSASDFYTGGAAVSGRQNGLAITGDYLSAAAFLGVTGDMSKNFNPFSPTLQQPAMGMIYESLFSYNMAAATTEEATTPKPVLGESFSWDDKGQVLMLARYAPDLSKRLQSIEVARLQGRGLATGVPKLAVDAGGAWLAWTDVVDGTARLQGARIAR